MLRNGVIPMPPHRNTAVRAASRGSVRSPAGPSICTAVPTGITFNIRLNTVSRMRVATMTLFSYGALAIVNVRVFPSASVSEGARRVISIAWPASNVQPGGFSKWKAMVPSAISWRAQAHRYSVSTYRASVVFGCARVSRTGATGSPTGKVRLYSARVASGLTAASRGQSTIIEDTDAKPGQEASRRRQEPVHSRPAPIAGRGTRNGSSITIRNPDQWGGTLPGAGVFDGGKNELAQAGFMEKAEPVRAKVKPVFDTIGPVIEKMGPALDSINAAAAKVVPATDRFRPVVDRAVVVVVERTGVLIQSVNRVTATANLIMQDVRPRIADISDQTVAIEWLSIPAGER